MGEGGRGGREGGRGYLGLNGYLLPNGYADPRGGRQRFGVDSSFWCKKGGGQLQTKNLIGGSSL